MPTFSVELIIKNIRLPINRTKDQGANAGDLSRKVQRVCLPRSNVKLGQKEKVDLDTTLAGTALM